MLDSFRVFGIFAGRITDKFGPRLVVTISGIILGLGYMLMSQISAIWQMYLFYGVLIAIGAGGTWIPLMSTVARWFVNRRGLASGIVTSGVGVGTIIMPLLANQLISSYSWRISYIIIGSIILIVTVIIAQFLKRDPTTIRMPADSAASVSANSPVPETQEFSLKKAVCARQFWIISVMLLFVSVCVQSVMVHIVPHATDIGISETAAATILSVIGFVSIGSKIGMGSFGDRFGSKRVMVLVLAFILVSLLWLQLATEMWMLYLFAVIFALGYGGFISVQAPIVAEFFGLRAHGVIFGLVMFSIYLGGAIGPLVAGSIFDASKDYYWAFILCAILSAAGLILLSLLKSTRPKK